MIDERWLTCLIRFVHRDSSPKLVPWNKFQLHKTELNIAGASIHAVLCPVRTDVQYVVVINLGAVPDPEKGLCNKSFLVPANMSGQWLLSVFCRSSFGLCQSVVSGVLSVFCPSSCEH